MIVSSSGFLVSTPARSAVPIAMALPCSRRGQTSLQRRGQAAAAAAAGPEGTAPDYGGINHVGVLIRSVPDSVEWCVMWRKFAQPLNLC